MTTLDITLIQTTLVWEDAAANRDHLARLIGMAGQTDLVVLPEMFSTGFSMNAAALAEPMTGVTVNWLSGLAAELQTAICGSVIIKDNGQYFNRFLFVGGDGRIEKYDKRHLFRMSTEQEHYSPGTDRAVIELKGFRLFPQVCYDLRFPVFSRNDLNYDLAIYVANWPAARRHHWLALLAARAIENQSYVVGVNRIGRDGNGVVYSGDSIAFDCNGSALMDAKDGEGCFHVRIGRQHLDEYRASFPAWKDADGFRLEGSPVRGDSKG